MIKNQAFQGISNQASQCGGANFRFDELSQDHGILHFVIGTSGIQNSLLVKSGNELRTFDFSKKWKNRVMV